MSFELVKRESIKSLADKACYYLKQGDTIAAQACIAQIKLINGHSKKDEQVQSQRLNYLSDKQGLR
mgnify:CR=1 FL=1